MKLRRRTAVVATAGALGMMVLAGVAWACTAQVGFAPLPVQAGPAGTSLALSGDATQRGAVEIRWNGETGPLLATAMADHGHHGTEFSTQVTVPQVDPGVYYLMLVANGGIGRAAFEVTPSAAVAGQPTPVGETAVDRDPWRAFDASDHPTAGVGRASSSSDFRAGIALLTLGSVALFAGAAVAGVRRSRLRVGRATR